MICQNCHKEIEAGNWLNIPELGIAVEIEVHHKGNSWKELNLSDNEKNLLTYDQCIFLANHPEYSKILKMDGSSIKDDFFIQQPFKLNRNNNYVAGFYSDSGYSGIGCGGDPSDSGSNLGVRFCRALKKRGSRKKK